MMIYMLLILSIGSLEAMTPPRATGAKRKLFERDVPSENLPMSPGKEYTTAPDTPATPYKIHTEKLAARGILPIAIQNMTDMPARIMYETAKGQAYRRLPEARHNFKESRLDAEISFREPVEIALSGVPFHRILFNRENNKLEIQEYRSVGYNPYVTIKGLTLNLSNPIIIQLKQNDKGWISIKND